MTPDNHDAASAAAHTAAWRELVETLVEQDRAELLAATADGARVRQHVKGLLQQAEGAAQPVRLRECLRQWWHGNAQDRAWLSMREAEAELDLLLAGPELKAHARDLLVKARGLLPSDDQRVKVVDHALNPQGPPPGQGPPGRGQNVVNVEPVEVAHLARAVGSELYVRYAHSRSFRNRLIRLTLIGVVALGLMLVAFATNAIKLPIAGVAAPSYIEIGLLVSLFGVVGALITAVPPLARRQGTWDPFSLQYYQMLLKIALGPIFAIIGVMLLQAGIIPNVTFPMRLADLLVWALAFGAAQQAVTRLVDARVPGLTSSDASDGTNRHQKLER